MTPALALEVAQDGILANCVAQAFVDTELTRRVLGDGGIAEIVRSVPAGRLAQPEEIAEAVRFFAGPENTFITRGQNIVVDGGFTRAESLVVQSHRGPYTAHFVPDALAAFVEQRPDSDIVIIDDRVADLYAAELGPVLEVPSTLWYRGTGIEQEPGTLPGLR